MMDSWVTLAAGILAMVGMLFSFVRWFMQWAEERDKAQEAVINKRLDDHKDEFAKVHERINKHGDELDDTREQMLNDYTKREDFKSLRSELKQDSDNIYQKMGGIDRALNQLIGLVKGKLSED